MIDGGPSGQLSVRVFRPAGATGTLPVLLYTHGAGSVFGDARTHDRLVRELTVLPATDAAFDTDSHHQFATGYFLARDGMKWFSDQYTTDPAQRAEITASPLRASLEDLAGLPPALVIVGEADVLRDEGEAYAAKLREAGVPVTAVRYQGIIHDFVMVNALRDTHAARAATRQGGEFLHEALYA